MYFETKVPPKQDKLGYYRTINTKTNIFRGETPNTKVKPTFFAEKMK